MLLDTAEDQWTGKIPEKANQVLDAYLERIEVVLFVFTV